MGWESRERGLLPGGEWARRYFVFKNAASASTSMGSSPTGESEPEKSVSRVHTFGHRTPEGRPVIRWLGRSADVLTAGPASDGQDAPPASCVPYPFVYP